MDINLKEKKVSFHRQNKQVVDQQYQQSVLNGGPFQNGDLPFFKDKISETGKFPLKPSALEILQVNVGYMCNQVCAHCHVDAGPDRKEIMTAETMRQILDILKKTDVHTLDITGGAPEMNPHFRGFVESAVNLGVKDIIVRSNLTIILANKSYNDLPEFFAKNRVHVVSSLPFYKQNQTDKQRGDGVFDASIQALKMLNAVGYGKENSGLKLDLVYNPAGAFLPAQQMDLEKEFKRNLKKDYGIEFCQLFCITNLPISRFLDYLLRTDNYEDYMHTLVDAYNPHTVDHVMCRNTLSISWDGFMYDCDFNQMLGLKVGMKTHHIADFNLDMLNQRNIVLSQHCYGCTAGAGSSCQGTVA